MRKGVGADRLAEGAVKLTNLIPENIDQRGAFCRDCLSDSEPFVEVRNVVVLGMSRLCRRYRRRGIGGSVAGGLQIVERDQP